MGRLLKIGLGIFFLVSASDVHAQGRKNLQKVRGEIQRLEADLRAKEDREQTLLEQVEDIDREVGLRKRLLQELEVQKQGKERKVEETESSLRRTTESCEKLKELVARRMVSMYKRGRIADWEALFSVSSLSQAAVWLKYQKRIAENDRRNLRLLQEKEAATQAQKQDLERALREKERLIQERRTETGKLEEKKTSRKKLLGLVQRDRQLILEKLQRTRLAYGEIRRRISREEEKRRASLEKVGGGRFVALKGRMDWPVKGRVVSKYGRHKHPILKTWTENLGIDIRAAEGDAVRAVSQGTVKWVTWQRGMGNLALLDHGGGYYTVYGHLEVVFVDSGEAVEGGGVIGRVGDRQSLNGPILHFQVWNGTTHYNPETWLR